MLFINTPALQIRASLTLEKHHGKYSNELQTTAATIKTAKYLNIFSIAKPVKILTTSATKVNAWKYLMQLLFINTPALQIRASLTLEKDHGNYFDKLLTATDHIKTAQYLKIFLTAHPVKTLTLFKTLKI